MKNKNNMMRNAFSVICLLLLAFSVSGQEETTTGKKIQFGIKVGTTISTFSEEQPHNNYKPGFIAGCFLSYKLSGNLALQFEPSYIQQGGTLVSIYDPAMFLIPDFPFAVEVKSQRVTFHNIDIPVLLKLEKNFQGLKIFCVAGPTVGLNFQATAQKSVSARSQDAVLPVYINFYEEENITSNIEFLQYGVIGGIGFEAPMGKRSLIFDMKYRYGLNKTYKGFSYLGIHQVQGDLSTNSFYFTLGFGF